MRSVEGSERAGIAARAITHLLAPAHQAGFAGDRNIDLFRSATISSVPEMWLP